MDPSLHFLSLFGHCGHLDLAVPSLCWDKGKQQQTRRPMDSSNKYCFYLSAHGRFYLKLAPNGIRKFLCFTLPTFWATHILILRILISRSLDGRAVGHVPGMDCGPGVGCGPGRARCAYIVAGWVREFQLRFELKTHSRWEHVKKYGTCKKYGTKFLKLFCTHVPTS